MNDQTQTLPTIAPTTHTTYVVEWQTTHGVWTSSPEAQPDRTLEGAIRFLDGVRRHGIVARIVQRADRVLSEQFLNAYRHRDEPTIVMYLDH